MTTDNNDHPDHDEPPGADYTLVVGDEPAARLTRTEQNLWEVAKTPGEKVRIAAYGSPHTVQTMASQLRHNKRATHRPEGTWTFWSGPIKGEPDRFGVWAMFTPPGETPPTK
jgi:hypothetical protein